MPPKRSAPSEPAKNFEVGDTKEGQNGKTYIVYEDKNGNKRWKTAPNQPEKNDEDAPDDQESGENENEEGGEEGEDEEGEEGEDEDDDDDDEDDDDEDDDDDDEDDDEDDDDEDEEGDEEDEEDEQQPRVERDYSVIFNFYKAPNDENRLFFDTYETTENRITNIINEIETGLFMLSDEKLRKNPEEISLPDKHKKIYMQNGKFFSGVEKTPF